MTQDTTCKEILEQSPLHLLHRAGQIADILFNTATSSTNLTPRQFSVLTCVACNENVSQAEIVARTGIDRSTLADVVRRLVSHGLLERKRTDEDARRYAVRLTQAGQEALSKARPAASDADNSILETLHQEHRAPFMDALRQIVEAMDKRDTA